MPAIDFSPELIKAYYETEYRVFTDPAITLRVGERNAALGPLYRLFGVDCAVFATGWNPHSRRTPDEENATRNQVLLLFLGEKHIVIPGVGYPTLGSWRAEESYFALGIDKQFASRIAFQFEQNAVVWCGADCVPELVFPVVHEAVNIKPEAFGATHNNQPIGGSHGRESI